MLSSHTDKLLLEEARNGVVCYVPKSDDAEHELIEAVKAAAGGESSALV
jgi:hypothetical protein